MNAPASNKYNGFLLSLVVPVYYEEECIQEFIDVTSAELTSHGVHYELVFIDDGSTDNTVAIIKKNAAEDTRIKLIEFSYNHGKEAAVTAGIRFASGDYLLYMDPDLQDPPDEIVNFLDKILEGYDLVFGVRKEKKDSAINIIYSKIFWFTLDKLTGLSLPRPLAVMRIFNRKFANEFNKYDEANRFIEGLFMHVGMRWTHIEVSQRERFAGVSKFNFRRKMQLALKAIFDFSDLPLKIATRFGAFLIVAALFATALLIGLRLFVMNFQLGWPSIFIMLTFSMGVQLFFLGLIGKYVGNIYRETKNRPLFSVKHTTNLKTREAS